MKLSQIFLALIIISLTSASHAVAAQCQYRISLGGSLSSVSRSDDGFGIIRGTLVRSADLSCPQPSVGQQIAIQFSGILNVSGLAVQQTRLIEKCLNVAVIATGESKVINIALRDPRIGSSESVIIMESSGVNRGVEFCEIRLN